MGQLKAQVLRFCLNHRLFVPGSAVLVACSGGADSVALLHLLSELAEELSIRLHVGHFNHRLRGKDSDDDARFVNDLATQLGLSCTVDTWDRPSSGEPSLEERARNARYAFLDTTARVNNSAVVALGHNASDQVETVLLNLIRGAGLPGIRGMLPLRGPYARPLLEVTRKQLIDYVNTKKQPYRQDASNFDPTWRRNRIRLSVIPPLAELNPRLAEDVGRMCRILRDENAMLETMAAETVSRLGISAEVPIPRESLTNLPPGLCRRVLWNVLRTTIAGTEIGSKHVEAVMSLLNGVRQNVRISLPSGFEFIRRFETVSLSLSENGDVALPEQQPLLVNGETWFGGWKLGAETIDDPDRIEKLRGEMTAAGHEVFDAGELLGPLVVRPAAPGDRIHPLGFQGRRKVSDILREAQVPPADRTIWPVITDGNKILWVVGLRRSNHALMREPTRQALKVTTLVRP